MRRIVHLSDLHFGRVDFIVLKALSATICEIAPDVVVVSGDLTQRARTREFRAARDFLSSLAFPQVVVPGNHDVPLYNIWMRAFHPLRRFRRFFGEEIMPFHGDAEVAIVGVNTARSLTFKDGRINRDQVGAVCARLNGAGENATRIVVTHHPFQGAEGDDDGLVGRAQMAMASFANCRVDIILSGHLHTSQSGSSASRYSEVRRESLLVQAGTATSIRRRGEPNSFNLIKIERQAVAVERWTWNDASAAFEVSAHDQFAKAGHEWRKSPAIGELS